MASIDTVLGNGRLIKPFQKTEQRRVLHTPVEAGGLGQGRSKWSAPVYIFDLTWEAPTKSAAEALRSFFATNHASHSITWTHANDEGGSTNYTCRFGLDGLRLDWQNRERWRYTIQLIGQPT